MHTTKGCFFSKIDLALKEKELFETKGVVVGMLKSLGDFLFGKSPDIFDNSGNIVHKLSKRTWDAWNNRIKMSPQYNWRNHQGTRAGTQPHQENPKST